MKQLKLVDGDLRMTVVVPDDDRLKVGKTMTLKGSERTWTIDAIYNVPVPNRGWNNNI